MALLLWIVALYIGYYTIMYAILVYKDGNKFGAVFVGILALATVITPYFIEIR